MWRRASLAPEPRRQAAISAKACSARRAMRVSAGCRQRSMETASGEAPRLIRRTPSINPIVVRPQPVATHDFHAEIANERFRPTPPIEPALLMRGLLGSCGAQAACAFIGAQRVGRIVEVFP